MILEKFWEVDLIRKRVVSVENTYVRRLLSSNNMMRKITSCVSLR